MRSTSAFLLLGAVACGNRAPGPAMITLSPATPTTDDDLLATIDDDAFEPEGQAVSYRFDWYKDGELAMPDAGDTLPANLTRKGETWRVEVTASDGNLAGDPIGAEVTVVNSPPTVSVSITPETPYSDDDLVAVADAQDPDGDTVSLSWSWTRDGQATGLAVDTVPASQTVRWQAWVVTVTPFDGTVEGTPASAGVEVENAPPEIFEVTHSAGLCPQPKLIAPARAAFFAGGGCPPPHR